MANSPDINKTQLVIRIERGLKMQIEKEANRLHLTKTTLVTHILTQELRHVELTPEDYRQIADEIEHDMRTRLKGRSPLNASA